MISATSIDILRMCTEEALCEVTETIECGKIQGHCFRLRWGRGNEITLLTVLYII
jgi:hypothetical protein